MWCNDSASGHGSFLDSNFFDFEFDFNNCKDHYKVLELNCDASDDEIRSNFIRLALKWHPDKLKEGDDSATCRFQQINEAYQVLSDPFTRREYDKKRMQHNTVEAIPQQLLAKHLCSLIRNGKPTSFVAGTTQPIQRAHIDLQWPWDEALSLVKCKTKDLVVINFFDRVT